MGRRTEIYKNNKYPALDDGEYIENGGSYKNSYAYEYREFKNKSGKRQMWGKKMREGQTRFLQLMEKC